MERVQEKYCKLKQRLKSEQVNRTAASITTKDTSTSARPGCGCDASSSARRTTIELLQSERDFYQAEYCKLLNRPSFEQLQRLQTELRAKEVALHDLQQRQQSGTPRPTQAQLNRAERERAVHLADCQRLRAQCEELRQRLQSSNAESTEYCERIELQQAELRAINERLMEENRTLCANRAALQSTADMLRERLARVERCRQSAEEDCVKVRTSYEQMRILQEQTEKALALSQSAMYARDHQLNSAESRANVNETALVCNDNAIKALNDQIAALQAQLASVDRQKEQVIDELDTKTERAVAAEAEALKWRAQFQDSREELETMRKKCE